MDTSQSTFSQTPKPPHTATCLESLIAFAKRQCHAAAPFVLHTSRPNAVAPCVCGLREPQCCLHCAPRRSTRVGCYLETVVLNMLTQGRAPSPLPLLKDAPASATLTLSRSMATQSWVTTSTAASVRCMLASIAPCEHPCASPCASYVAPTANVYLSRMSWKAAEWGVTHQLPVGLTAGMNAQCSNCVEWIEDGKIEAPKKKETKGRKGGNQKSDIGLTPRTVSHSLLLCHVLMCPCAVRCAVCFCAVCNLLCRVLLCCVQSAVPCAHVQSAVWLLR